MGRTGASTPERKKRPERWVWAGEAMVLGFDHPDEYSQPPDPTGRGVKRTTLGTALVCWGKKTQKLKN